MTELCEGSETGAQLQAASRGVVVFGAGFESSGADLVARTLQYMAAEDLVGGVRLFDVSRASDGDIDAGFFVFLLDNRFFSCVGGVAAGCHAMRQVELSGAMIVPVLLDERLSLDTTPFADMQPIRLHSGANVAGNLAKLESSVLAHPKPQPKAASTMVPPVPPSAAERLAGTSQIAEVVDLMPCHMSIYDDFVEQLVSKLQIRRMRDEQRHLNLFSEALKDLFNAEMVYCYLRTGDGQLHVFEAESNRPLHGCSATMVHGVLEDALESFENNRRARSMLLKNFLPELATADSAVECTVVVNERLANCGVFIAAQANASRYPRTEIICTIINSLHDYFTSSEARSFEKLKARVYDDLKRNYRYVSDDMYQDRLRLFSSQISHLGVQFEPILQFDRERRQVSIYAYEALAREDETAVTAPVEVFQTANLWGMGFQSEVDKQLLQITLDTYEAQLRATGVAAADIKPLSLNVYPATLRDFQYREMLCRRLEQSELLSGHNLIMEVSEKTVVTPGSEGEPRRQLEEYRRLVRQIGELTGGVRYAIDDFGVGNASLSRLDRLNPHYVKIDRDILSFEPRMASTLIRYLVESQPERGTSVILEGVDIHSHFKLHEIVNDMGVGLVQGYCLSKAVSDINGQWERELCDNAAAQVGWPLVETAPPTALH